MPLESSYQRVNRCIYTSTGLYEYKGFMSKPANDKHRMFTWGLRAMEVSHSVSQSLGDSLLLLAQLLTSFVKSIVDALKVLA